MTQNEFKEAYYKMVKDRPVNEPQWHLRDQFAMAALTGLLSANPDEVPGSNPFAAMAVTSYLFADAMLEARKVKE